MVLSSRHRLRAGRASRRRKARSAAVAQISARAASGVWRHVRELLHDIPSQPEIDPPACPILARAGPRTTARYSRTGVCARNCRISVSRSRSRSRRTAECREAKRSMRSTIRARCRLGIELGDQQRQRWSEAPEPLIGTGRRPGRLVQSPSRASSSSSTAASPERRGLCREAAWPDLRADAFGRRVRFETCLIGTDSERSSFALRRMRGRRGSFFIGTGTTRSVLKAFQGTEQTTACSAGKESSCYSSRHAIIGSTRVARRAGT